jgi:diguanylate cyclase (GGDEF)-like protein
MMKISLLIVGILLVAISTYAAFTVWQFNRDKLAYILDVNASLSHAIARKVQGQQEAIDHSIQNMVSLIHYAGLEKEKNTILKVLFQSEPNIVSFGLFQKHQAQAGQIELVPVYALYNRNFMDLQKITDEQLRELSINALNSPSSGAYQEGDTFIINQPQWKLLTYVIALNQDKSHVCVVHISKEFFYEAMGESKIHDTYVVDPKGVVVAQNNVKAPTQSLSGHPLFSQAQQSPLASSGSEFDWADHGAKISYVGNFVKLDKHLLLVTQLDKKKAFEGVHAIILNTIFFSLLLLGISIIVAVLFSKTITAPLQRLMVATENLAAGNYKVEIPIQTNDEVGQLADYFVELGRKLDERETQLEEATELAIRDGMTGLYNHRHFRNQVNQFFQLARRHDQDLSILLVDIDHFKKVNDTYGHQQGDAVLKEMSQILKSLVRDTDIAARYGGEEFVVVLPQTDMQGAQILAERIRESFRTLNIKNVTGEGSMSATCSIGVTTLRLHPFGAVDDFIKQADENLYAAKRGGRDKVIAA